MGPPSVQTSIVVSTSSIFVVPCRTNICVTYKINSQMSADSINVHRSGNAQHKRSLFIIQTSDPTLWYASGRADVRCVDVDLNCGYAQRAYLCPHPYGSLVLGRKRDLPCLDSQGNTSSGPFWI